MLMKHFKLTFVLTMLLSMAGLHAYASDIEVDGIYYKFNANTKTAEVTFKGDYEDSYYNEYTGAVVIPSEVTFTYGGEKYSVTSIGNYAFYNCPGLTSITIPNSVTRIGSFAFHNCSGLTSVIVESGNTKYDSRNNCNAIIETASNTLVVGCKNTIIPNSVTSIGSSAFYGCTGLTSITIPNSVTSIGSSAFYGCSGLTTVTIPNSVTSIGRGAFSDCSGLTSVTIGNSVTSIGGGAFESCSALTSITLYSNEIVSTSYNSQNNFKNIFGEQVKDCIIGDGVTSIGNYFFYNCSGLTSITIPNSVTRIGNYAFFKCSKLASINIPNGVTSIGGYAFCWCGNLSSITIPNSLTTIDQWVFANCSGLTSITIPNSVTSIEYRAFSGCEGLESIKFGNGLTKIGIEAFGIWTTEPGPCNNLKKVIINDVSDWLKISFADPYANPLIYAKHLYSDENTEITDLTIPDVTNIPDYAFYNCTGLTSVTIPNSVTNIGIDAFYGTTWYNNQPDGLIYAGLNAYKYKGKMPTNTSITIKQGTVAISQSAFSGCSGLVSITIPNSVTSIGCPAFSGCSGLTSMKVESGNTKYDSRDNCNAIIETASNTLVAGCKNTDIPNSVTSIGNSAFSDCYDLASVTIPNSVTSIGDRAFYQCYALTSVTLNSNAIVSKAYTSSNNLNNIFGTRVTNYIIGQDVKSIGENAFYGCDKLTSVTLNSNTIVSKTYTANNNMKTIFGAQVKEYIIGQAVKNIGENAFSGYTNLTSVTLNSNTIVSKTYTPNNNMKTIFGEQVKKYVIGDDVTSIGVMAFYDCSGLTSITIPNSVTYIGTNAFEHCSGLTSITIPNSVTSIGGSAFSSCSGLTSVTIGNSVTSIGYSAFSSCSKLTSVTIPNSVTSIGYSAFRDCSGLTSVTIGNSVTSIDDCAFQYCSKLTSVTALNPTPVAITQNVFSNRTNATLYVIKRSKEAYQAANYWKEFKKIEIAHLPTHKLIYMVDGEEYRSYDVEEEDPITPVTAPTKVGYTFSGWSEIPKTMPDHDVTVTGTFTINSYKLIYKVDGEVVKSDDVEYGTTITPEENPTKEGYTFSGWSEIPETMPAHDVTITGTFSINSYKLIYTVDGQEYKSSTVQYGATITPETTPTKEGYTFSGWSDIPATMPAHDVTITGTFSVNSYKLTYMIDNEVYKNVTYEYGATITPEPTPEGNYATFEWTDLPQTMPAHDVVVHATYTTGITDILKDNRQDVKVYSPNGKMLAKPEKGINIIRMKDGTTRKVVVK